MENFSFYPLGLVFSLVFIVGTINSFVAATHCSFKNDINVIWGKKLVNISKTGHSLTLGLDNTTGSSFQSKDSYLFGRFDMQIKLVPNDSAGTVTTFYLSSFGPNHDEIDFEFLGNQSGQPYTIHTNVYSQGEGGREQQFRLWFDPTTSFHTYTILWNPRYIMFLVDKFPLRIFYNNMTVGVPFPISKPMWFFASLWSADDWATQGGRIKTNWTHSPFVASYKNCNVKNACIQTSSSKTEYCPPYPVLTKARNAQYLNPLDKIKLKWVQKTHKLYDYCTDFKRFPKLVPRECKRGKV